MMSEVSDCKQSADSAAATRKRCASPSSPDRDRDQDSGTVPPRKATKVDHTTSSEKPSNSQSEYKTGDEDDGNNNTARRGTLQAENGEGGEPSAAVTPGRGSGTNNVTDSSAATTTTNNNNNNSARAGGPDASSTGKAQSSDLRGSVDAKKVDTAKGTGAAECHPSTSSVDQSDSAAIAAAEALASLTRGDGEDSRETPCSSGRAGQQTRVSSKSRHGRDPLRESSRTQAAAADSSTSAQRGVDRGEGAVGTPDAEEGDDSLPGSSTSTPSSSFPSDDDDNDDGECAIVSVKMAPEVRQSVALLAQVQMRLEALEKKSARLHQRLEVKMSRQRRPHLDQRSSITQSIPGFWVTALLNHPHLSAHIDETDEDALSYMIDLEIESFKNSKLGYRIVFHFRRNPYFQNNMIMKELHLGMGGSPVSFSNAILWLRGQNLTAHSEPRKTSRGVYQTFFSWFGDHSGPSRDDIAQILKDDLYRDPLRYYLTPLWEPRENGSSSTSGARAADNSNGDECVVISDSDEEEDQEQDEVGQGHSREEDEDEEEEQGGPGAGSDDSDLAAREEEEDEEEEEESFGEKEEESDVEELDDSSRGQKAGERDDEEDVEVDEEENESKD